MFTHWSSLESTDCIQAYGTSKPETHIGIRPDGGSHIEVQARVGLLWFKFLGPWDEQLCVPYGPRMSCG